MRMDTLPVLCLLGILCSLALAIDKPNPPEDLDGSADDEDFSGSGSGDAILVDSESRDVTLTSVSTLAPIVEGSTAAQEPEIVDEEETKAEVTTKSTETTKSSDDVIEDLFAVDTDAKEATTQKATTSPIQTTSAADLVEEIDVKKHHHHHHHHHTTTSSTTLPPDDGTTDIPPEVDLPEKTTPSTADKDSELLPIPDELTTPVQDLAKHDDLLEETTSGSTSAYVDNEVTVDPLDAENLPAVDAEVTTAVPEDAHTHKDHHHHHHHPNHQTTTSGGSDVQQEVTTSPSELIEHEGKVQEGEPTTAVTEEEHPHHGHPHHHETTPSPTTMSVEPEKPHEVHTHEPKGRRVHVPDVISTTAIPVINEDERIPEDSETDDVTSSTVQYNASRNPFDEIDESTDSKEEGSTGVDEDIFFEATVPEIKKGRMMPDDPSTATDDEGSSNASHGIMERKELLAGIIAGGVAGLVFAAALVAFVLYRMKKKDEGSYALEEPKQSNGGYQKPREQREFYA